MVRASPTDYLYPSPILKICNIRYFIAPTDYSSYPYNTDPLLSTIHIKGIGNLLGEKKKKVHYY
jgi:hypothetical protein